MLKSRSQELKFKNTVGAKNYFIEDINQNDLMSKKHKKVWMAFKLY